MGKKNSLTLNGVLELYILDRTPSTSTIESYKKFIKVFERDTQIYDINILNKDQLNHWKKELLARVRPISANTYLRHIKTLIRFAFEEDLITSNPFLKFRMCKTPDKPFKSIINSDLNTAISFIKTNALPPSWFWEVAIYTLYYTGMRRRQLVGLVWSDINFKYQTIRLRSDISKTGKEWTIPIHDALLPCLFLLKNNTHDCYGSVDISHLQVFNITLFNFRYSGNKLTVDQLSGFFRNLQNKAKVNISAHRFRHRLATDLTNNANSIKDVQVILGHSDVKSTLAYVSTDIKKMRTTLMSTTPV